MELQVPYPIVTEELYKQYYAELLRFGFRLCNSESQAEDLVQNAFLKLKLAEDKGDGIENIRPWLYRVIYNDFLTQSKRNSKSSSLGPGHGGIEDRNSDPLSDYDREERKRIVREELQHLKYKDRTILLLYGEELSYKEIAEVMEIGQSYVGSYIARARNNLIKRLKENYNEMFE